MRQPDDKNQKPAASAAAQTDAAAPREVLSHQEKVYFEMFRAIEQLGRKLEKAEAERYMLSRRLADIEEGAERDEATGRFYLPAKIDAPAAQSAAMPMPRVMLAAIAASVVIAFCALGAVMTQDMPQKLSAQQLAALDNLSARPVQTAAWHRTVEKTEKTEIAKAEEPAVAVQTLMPAQTEAAPTEVAAAVDTAAIAPAAAGQEKMTQAQVAQAPALHEEEEAAEDFAAHLEGALDDLPQETAAAPSVLPAALPDADVSNADVTDSDVSIVTEGAEPSFAEVTAEDNTAEVLSEAPAPVSAASPVKPVPAAVVATKQIPAQPAAPLMRDSRLPAPLQALEARAFEGYAEAQHDLAATYAEGNRTRQDYERARAWFTRAAAGGVANAHYNLGVMAQQGLGSTANMQQAMAHYEDAAKLGHAEAMYNLGLLYAEGRAVPKSAWRAVTYFKRAANAGLVQAAYNLGVIYEGDALGTPDINAAIEWYDVAAREGNRDAALAVRRLKGQRAQASVR
ncbi:MAG TPA: hypothetical protein PLW48_00935 [Alphaproteobacteria bacterium]|nr:hypothetical protein [Alphaproteobacteria bacterium]